MNIKYNTVIKTIPKHKIYKVSKTSGDIDENHPLAQKDRLTIVMMINCDGLVPCVRVPA